MTEDVLNPFAETQRKHTLRDKFIPRKYVCTVVSLLPFEPFPESKPHLNPSTFRIPKANSKTGVGVLYVGEAHYHEPDPFSNRNTKVPVSPNEIARSVVEDYINGQMGLDEGAAPGLFWVEGELTEVDVLEAYPELVKDARDKQINWFKRLVDLADADFVKNKNRLAISDIQKHAARYLNYKAEWVDFIANTLQDTKLCIFCKFTLLADAVKCTNCHEIVDQVAYDKLRNSMSGEVKNG